ncbi:hypothetical protein [Sutcliffiella deserti]|uniref:hypothetical protein n=1 Tax=Sutcliffiella deserti TaxID=2875501 RepID=UPI001CBE6B6B|nr:hypothetical protein [Sutcliffiella deserti]
MNEEVNIQVVTNLVNNIDQIKEEIENFSNPVREYSALAENLIYPYKLTISALTIANRIRFKRFLKEFSKSLEKDKINDIYISKLENFLKKEKNLEFVGEIINSSVKSKTSKASAIMGYYAGDLLNELREIHYKDLIILDALTLLNNNDFDNFLIIYEKFYDKLVTRNISSIRVHDSKKEFESLNVACFELENTIEKLKSVLIFGYDVGGLGNVGNAWGSFKFNENTHYFFEIIKKSKIMEIFES